MVVNRSAALLQRSWRRYSKIAIAVLVLLVLLNFTFKSSEYTDEARANALNSQVNGGAKDSLRMAGESEIVFNDIRDDLEKAMEESGDDEKIIDKEFLQEMQEKKIKDIKAKPKVSDQNAKQAMEGSEQKTKKTETPRRPKVAFVYLLGLNEEENMVKSVGLLFKNYNNRFKHPVYVYYEKSEVLGNNAGTFDRIKTRVRSAAGENAYLIEFFPTEFKFPDIDPEKYKKVTTGWNDGYNHMIRFWFRNICLEPQVRSLDYYIRMDTDSFWESEVTRDWFEKPFVYAYIYNAPDAYPFLKDLANLVQDYAKTHPEVRERARKNNYELPQDHQDIMGFYTNFEIVHVPSMFRPDVWNFTEAIDQSGGIYKWRWGDAVLRWLQINMFFDWEKDVVHRCDLDYVHQHHAQFGWDMGTRKKTC